MLLQDLKINPLRIGSGLFFLVSPFATWMTLSTFGFVTGSTLLEVANSQTNFPISKDLASSALYSVILLIFGGFVSLRSTKLGVPLGTLALLIFGVESYSAFGTFSGVVPVSILPGLGFFLSIVGIVLGLGSFRTRDIPFTRLLPWFRTQKGLEKTGISVTIIALAADGWSHWAAEQISEFAGVTLYEGTLHLVVIFGSTTLLAVLLVQKSLEAGKIRGILALSVFGALVLDAVYHVTTGSASGFVGHGSIEILLHALAYYGISSLVIARFLLKR